MKKSFTLSRFNKNYFGIFALLFATVFFVFLGKNVHNVGELLGKLFAYFTIPVVVAFCAWFVRRRKENAGQMTFNVVLTLILAGQVSQFSAGLNKRLEQNKILQEMQDQRETLKSTVTEEDQVSDATLNNYVSSSKDSMSKLSEESDSKSEKQFYTLMISQLEETESVGKLWRDSANAVQAERILDYSRLKDVEEIAYQKQTLKHYIEKTESYRNYSSNAVSNLEEKLSPLTGKGKILARNAIIAFKEHTQARVVVLEALMQTHLDYGKLMIELIGLLKNNNDWSFENEELVIADDNLLDKFNQINEAMGEKEDRIKRLERKMR